MKRLRVNSLLRNQISGIKSTCVSSKKRSDIHDFPFFSFLDFFCFLLESRGKRREKKRAGAIFTPSYINKKKEREKKIQIKIGRRRRTGSRAWQMVRLLLYIRALFMFFNPSRPQKGRCAQLWKYRGFG